MFNDPLGYVPVREGRGSPFVDVGAAWLLATLVVLALLF